MTMEPRDFPVAWDLAGYDMLTLRDISQIVAATKGKPVILAAERDRFALYDAKTEEPIAIIFNIGEDRSWRDGADS